MRNPPTRRGAHSQSAFVVRPSAGVIQLPVKRRLMNTENARLRPRKINTSKPVELLGRQLGVARSDFVRFAVCEIDCLDAVTFDAGIIEFPGTNLCGGRLSPRCNRRRPALSATPSSGDTPQRPESGGALLCAAIHMWASMRSSIGSRFLVMAVTVGAAVHRFNLYISRVYAVSPRDCLLVPSFFFRACLPSTWVEIDRLRVHYSGDPGRDKAHQEYRLTRLRNGVQVRNPVPLANG
jgi:hypothetical protein